MSQWGADYNTSGYNFSQYPQYTTSNRRADGAAIAAFILALSSIIFWIVPAVVALFLAPAAKRRIRAAGEQGHGIGLATAAQVISIISLAIGALILLAFAAS